MTLVNLLPAFEFLGRFVGGPEIALIIVGALIKIALILGHVLHLVPIIIWVERRVIGFVQDRPGPNRVGPFGILQAIMDGLKLFQKEDLIPRGADRLLFLVAPALTVIPAFLALCIVPFGPEIAGQAYFDLLAFFGLQSLWSPSASMAIAIINPNIGVLWVFAITSVSVYGITMAGWASENKWSLMGGIRASAQMISYEISLSLSIIGVLLIAGSLNLYEIIDGQSSSPLAWNVIAQPVGFLLFVVAMFAETNRLPFDLAEGEAELTGGFHTEYSSMKWAIFFLAEYTNMITASAVCATLFLGGYHLIPVEWVEAAIVAVITFFSQYTESGLSMSLTTSLPTIIASLLAPLGVALKIGAFMMLFILARAILPRLRYDQVMNLGWKVMLVAGLINLVVTAVGVALISGLAVSGAEGLSTAEAGTRVSEALHNWKWTIGLVTLVMLIVADRMHIAWRRRYLRTEYRSAYHPTKMRPPARKTLAVGQAG